MYSNCMASNEFLVKPLILVYVHVVVL
jgi:hypothetical protein